MNHDAIEQIRRDFTQGNAPFDEATFPEEELLDTIEPETRLERGMLLTTFCNLDYNRDARRLRDNLIELYERDARWFSPLVVSRTRSEEELSDVMTDIGFRYGSRDAAGLYHNYSLLSSDYGTVQGLLSVSNADAPRLVEEIRGAGFKYLQGKKLAPFYARVVNDYLQPLNRVWELDIPVDTHIRKLTHQIADVEDDDEIRAFWREYGQENDVSPHVIDGALWHIGNKWDEWGEEYFNSVSS